MEIRGEKGTEGGDGDESWDTIEEGFSTTKRQHFALLREAMKRPSGSQLRRKWRWFMHEAEFDALSEFGSRYTL